MIIIINNNNLLNVVIRQIEFFRYFLNLFYHQFSDDCSIEQQPNILMNLFQKFLLEFEGYKDLYQHFV